MDHETRVTNAHVTDVASRLDLPVDLTADMGGTFVLQIDLGTRDAPDDPNDRAGIDPTDHDVSFWWIDINGGAKTIISTLDIHADPAAVASWIGAHAKVENCPATRPSAGHRVGNGFSRGRQLPGASPTIQLMQP